MYRLVVELWHCVVVGVLLISRAERTTSDFPRACVSRNLNSSEIPGSQTNVTDFKAEDAMGFLTDLIGGLVWTHVTLVSDQDNIGALLFQLLQGRTVAVGIHYVNTSVLSHRHDSLVQSVLGPAVRHDHVLLVGTTSFQRAVLWQMEALSNETGLSRYVIDTCWLLLASNDVINELDMTSITLNNMAVVTYDKGRQLRVKTLLHKTDGHVLSDVTKQTVSSRAAVVTSAQLYPNRRNGLNGRRIRVGINTWYLYISAIDHGNGNTTYIGFCMDLLDIFAQALNFRYSLMLPPDGRWGDKYDGHWTGLFGMIEKQEVDLVAAPLIPILKRKEVSDWPKTPFDYVYIGIVVADSKQSGLRLWSAYLNFFKWQVYACICGSFVFAVLCLKVLLLWEHRLRHGGLCYCQVSIIDIIQHLLGTILNKAVGVHSTWDEGPSSRLFVACWCLLGFLLTSCYTCQLASLLVATPSPLPFTSFADMATRDDIRWGTINDTAITQEFRESKDEVKRTIYQKMMKFAEEDPEVLSLDPDIHEQKVLSGGYAFFGEGLTLEMWASKHCQLKVIRDDNVGRSQTYNFFTPKDSLLLKKMDTLLLRFEDMGILTHLRRKWNHWSETCDDNSASPQGITLSTLQGPCYFAVAALFLAACGLLCERYFVSRY